MSRVLKILLYLEILGGQREAGLGPLYWQAEFRGS
ncbi:unnamed protein product [Arabidopsis halleri]